MCVAPGAIKSGIGAANDTAAILNESEIAEPYTQKCVLTLPLPRFGLQKCGGFRALTWILVSK